MTDAEAVSSSRQKLRFGLWSLFVIGAVLAILFARYEFHRKFVEPRRYSRVLKRRLDSLVTRRPNNMSPQQWEHAVTWTLNLHANSQIMFQADGPSIHDFEQRLAEKLSGDVSMDTIHWIWDEYARVCVGGKNYQKFKPRMLDEIGLGGPN